MKIPRASSLHLEAAEHIREMIENGELLSGSRIPERELCERFDISRTPLREALKVLAAEGLIHLTQNRGARVVKLTREDIKHMFQVLGNLESLAGELACARMTDAEFAEIRALHYQMLAHYERHEVAEYYKLNRQIHETIVALARNPVLSQIYESLAGRVQRSRYMADMPRQRWSEAVQDHERMLEALAARDGTRLAEIMRSHLDHKFDVVSGSEIVSEDNENEARRPA